MIILLLIAVALVSLLCFVKYHLHQSEMKRCYAAAYRMIKEKSLVEAICNQKDRRQMGTVKKILYLQSREKGAHGYVFDTEHPIRIGRDAGQNEVAIHDSQVSSCHCCIFCYENQLYVQDMRSSNGTWLLRGFRKYRVLDPCILQSGDRLLVGETTLKVHIFWFESQFL